MSKEIVTLEALQQAQSDMADWVRQYVADAIADAPTPVDPTAEAVKRALDQLNGEVIGTTSWEKVSAALAVKNIMQARFSSLGFTQAGIFSHYPSFINKLATPTGVFIEDTDGNLWTASDWTNYHTSETAYACVVLTSSLSFRIGFQMFSSVQQPNMMWYGAPIYSAVNDAYNESRTPLDLTKAIIATACPAMLGQDRAGANFSKDTLIANLPTTGEYYDSLAAFQELTSGDTSKVYVVNYAGTTDGSDMHVYYWSGTQFIDTGAKSTSLASNQALLGIWRFSAFTGDTTQWHEPNMAWARAIYQNISAVDACFIAVTGSALNRQYIWSCQQQSASGGWYFGLSNGYASNYYKDTSYYALPCAEYE